MFPGSYVSRVLCSQGPKFPKLPGSDIPKVRCSQGPLFPGSCVPRVLCLAVQYSVNRITLSLLLCSGHLTCFKLNYFIHSIQGFLDPRILCCQGRIFPRSDVPRILSFQDPMFPGSYVPRVQCFQGPMFPGSYVSRVQCFQGPMFPGSCVRQFNILLTHIIPPSVFGSNLTCFKLNYFIHSIQGFLEQEQLKTAL